MLDQEDRHVEVVADKTDRVHQLRRLVRVHARSRLIEQQQLRIGRHGARDLQLALLAVRQVGREQVALPVEVKDLEQLDRLLGDLFLALAESADVQTRLGEGIANAVAETETDIVKHAHLAEQADILKRAGNAELVDLNRRLAVEADPVERDGARGGLVNAGQHVEDRRLAGTVRSDQTVQLPLFNGEIEAVDRLESAEPDGQILGFQQCHYASPPACFLPVFARIESRSFAPIALSFALLLISIIAMRTIA